MARVGHHVFQVISLCVVLGASADAEPGKDDGCSCGSPWVGYPLPCRRRVPASLSARVSLRSLGTLPRVPPHRGCASSEARWHLSTWRGPGATARRGFGGARQLWGHGPPAARAGTGQSDGDAGGLGASGPQLTRGDFLKIRGSDCPPTASCGVWKHPQPQGGKPCFARPLSTHG